jgi:cytochrome c
LAIQLERGGAVYAEHCARCHGDAGEGGDRAPALVGTGALPKLPRPDQERAVTFRSALDVAVFATQSMPPKAEERRNLSEPDYWAVLAFALQANGVELTEPVGPGNAGAIILHP